MSNTRTKLEGKTSHTITTIVVVLIQGYQKYISPLLHQLLGIKAACRTSPTCSEYAQNAIRQYGIGRGMILSVRRLINCQPLFRI